MLRFKVNKKRVGCGHSKKGRHGYLELKEVYEEDHIKHITLRISGNELCDKHCRKIVPYLLISKKNLRSQERTRLTCGSKSITTFYEEIPTRILSYLLSFMTIKSPKNQFPFILKDLV
jgi:hypothetical protein